jgi:hypothetical protein
MTIPVVLCLDVEPNRRQVSRRDPEPWTGYEVTQRYIEALRPRLAEVTGAPARISWFLRMDPQVAEPYGSASWTVDRYRGHLESVRALGDELGIHPHAYRWHEDLGAWVHEFGDQAWVEHCLESSLEAFERSLGQTCRLLRFGDKWLNTATVNHAERLGIRYDLTVEPGAPPLPSPEPDEPATGPVPDYYRVPRAPYVPSPTEFRRPHRGPARSIRMIPLTSGYRRLGLRPHRYLRRLVRNGWRHRLADTPLSMWSRWTAPDTFDRMLDRALAAQRRPYLAFGIRSDIGAGPRTGERTKLAMEALLVHPARARFRFCTPAEALAILDAPGDPAGDAPGEMR